MPRPNVAPRPSCRYYGTPLGCFAGQGCHYLHADPTYTPFEQNKTCRFFAQGYCKRGSECWFLHDKEGVEEDGSEEASVPAECGICYEERPTLYGLLNGCSHAFCLKCIRQWRDPDGKGPDMQEAATNKKCPMCRKMTSFITPSSIHYPEGDPRKEAVIEQYKQSMARVPCRYFTRSNPDKRFCPFGRDCFYQHLNEDGTPYVFADGIDTMMQVRLPQKRRRRPEFLESVLDTLDMPDTLEVSLGTLTSGPEDGLASPAGESASASQQPRHLTERRLLLHMAVQLQTLVTSLANSRQTEEEREDNAGNESVNEVAHSDEPHSSANASRPRRRSE